VSRVKPRGFRAVHALPPVLVLLLTDCAARPPVSEASGVPGVAEPLRTGPRHPVSAARVRESVNLLAAACPPPSAADPTPGLSPSARALAAMRPPGVFPTDTAADAKALEALLATTTPDTIAHARLLDRLAGAYFEMERAAYEGCRSIVVLEDLTPAEFDEVDAKVRRTAEDLRASRAAAEGWCARLRREHPDYRPRVPCP
jgi:hypothetical protein